MKICPYHGKVKPCGTCKIHGMGEFAFSPRDSPPPSFQYSKPRTHGHSHGNVSPCKIRCGANEGLCILNNQDKVNALFTDSLIGCVQIIFRSDKATFVCHIFSGARTPEDWSQWAHERFVHFYGQVNKCYVVTGDDSGVGNSIEERLKSRLPEVVRVRNCCGYTINIKSGEVGETPQDWYTSRQDIAGWQTAKDLIHLQLLGPWSIGDPFCGDFYELCNACKTQ